VINTSALLCILKVAVWVIGAWWVFVVYRCLFQPPLNEFRLKLKSSLFYDVHSEHWCLVTDVSGNPICPIFRGQAIQEKCQQILGSGLNSAKKIRSFKSQELLNHWQRITSDDMTELLTWLRGSADKSLARPTSQFRRTESIVSLERRVYSCAELQVFSCYRG